MLKIEPNGETYLTRGDTAFIKPIVEVEDEEKQGKFDPYEFQENDRVIFRLALNSNSPVLVEKDCYIDLENNKAVLTIDPEDTQDLEPRVYFYCMELVTATGNHFTFIENTRFTIGKELEKRE